MDNELETGNLQEMAHERTLLTKCGRTLSN